ncbi:MAG TPA: nuclear transport factor 2 family protein [Polyangiaceae bacterium]|nr:nuclear transport factor 2 family protein [Polyangiaceae bacterium]
MGESEGSELESTIRALEQRLWAAQRASDVAVLGELLADDALFTGLNGTPETKDSDLAQHRSGALKIVELRPLDLRIRPIPSGAITAVKMHGEALINGQRVVATLSYTRVWSERGGRWQIVGAHMSANMQP